MKKKSTLKNLITVLVLTAFTAIAVVATVQATGRILGTGTASAAAATAQQSTAQSGSGSSQGSGQGYDQQQYGQGGSSSGGGSSGSSSTNSDVFTPDPETGLYTCPGTGCQSSSCHALN